jgi:hypothetical protein
MFLGAHDVAGAREMTFTTAEKLQLVMLCDSAKPAKERELDYDFIYRAVVNGDA